MKLLFDQNISYKLVSRLNDIFPESRQIRDCGLENSTDKQIWKFAKEKDYVIVTFDGDFYDFSLVWGHPPKIIWLRTFNQTTKNIEKIIRKFYEKIQEFKSDSELACLEIIESSEFD
jgi:predicted nuclease of predicted toxin-antitoxin system